MNESKDETERIKIGPHDKLKEIENRVINVERAIEAICRLLEESGQVDDEAGWYGRPE